MLYLHFSSYSFFLSPFSPLSLSPRLISLSCRMETYPGVLWRTLSLLGDCGNVEMAPTDLERVILGTVAKGEEEREREGRVGEESEKNKVWDCLQGVSGSVREGGMGKSKLPGHASTWLICPTCCVGTQDTGRGDAAPGIPALPSLLGAAGGQRAALWVAW